MKVPARHCVLTELDYVRLANLSVRSPRLGPCTCGARDIEELLDDARIVPSREVAPDIVTMYSQVLVRGLEEGSASKLTLCYPSDAEPDLGFVSVLSPVGMSLIGQRLGATVRWVCPSGEVRMAEVAEILFQPEASGDYVT